jgi:hypothetical protein
MSDEVEPEDGRSSARGEAAWKEARERVAERNHAARKAGKRRREAYERQREEARRAAERQRHSDLLAKLRTP